MRKKKNYQATSKDQQMNVHAKKDKEHTSQKNKEENKKYIR